MLRRTELACMYFPYADPAPSPALLTAALLFDRIHFLELNFFRPPGVGTAVPRDGRLPAELRDLGCFTEIGPDLLGLSQLASPGRAVTDASVRAEIQASIGDDLADDEFRRLAADTGKAHWLLPNGQYLFWAGLGIMFDYVAGEHGGLVPVPEVLATRPRSYQDVLARYGYPAEVRPFAEQRLRQPAGELMVRLPFEAAESLMLTVALHACRELRLVPFTDSALHQRFLNVKLGRLARRLTADALPGPTPAYPRLGTELIELSLPRIENLTPRRVGQLRTRCRDQLEAFRDEVLKMAAEIEVNAWEPDFERHLARYIDANVRPALLDLERKLHDLKRDVGLVLLEKSATTAPLPLLVSVFTGIPVEWVLPASVGIVSLKELLSYATNRSRLKRNGLSFLLDLG
ncbi:hypothetical protein Daura_33200 [Dactylosporangium aurantiacum]|uniref:Uncharacterized protein n=1 Tax=Dactylosporangium aurantiacum TaxID=35754 RepID=A0A9Q9MJ52_9ACTN|nr:hypothetical protein [Dactylosporangium aurantiacum]MDG6105051.1 hypothetical protein [Dactylosporangium aurantiacum]UWZ51582.1 hypothetical protein Daura_33200 [Dactylosporangium aurantiacum]